MKKNATGAGSAGRRVLTFFLTVVLIVGVLSMPAFAADDTQYSDERWNCGRYSSDFGDMAARRLYVYGMLDNKAEPKGDGTDADLTFNSEEQATRLDAAMLLYRLCGHETAEQHPFSDVPEEFDDALNWLFAKGITKGISDELYGTGAVTRWQFCVMLSRLFSWGTDNPNEAVSIAVSEHILPYGTNSNIFSNGDMYLTVCELLDRSFPDRRIIQRPQMSCPKTMRVSAISYDDAVVQIRAAAAFLPNRIEITFSESCPEDDLQKFIRHFDWLDGDKDLPIIDLTDRMHFVPYSFAQKSDREFLLQFNSYAPGYVACISKTDWLKVYSDDTFRDRILQLARENVEPLKKYQSEYERVSYAHDLLCRLASYDYEEYYGVVYGTSVRHPDAHKLLGFISSRKIVCDGYANVYQWFLTCLGIESYIVYGRIGENGHVWNKVRIDGVWYNVDVCWDDTGSNNRKFFLRSDDWMTSNRHCFSDTYSTTVFASPRNYQ